MKMTPDHSGMSPTDQRGKRRNRASGSAWLQARDKKREERNNLLASLMQFGRETRLLERSTSRLLEKGVRISVEKLRREKQLRYERARDFEEEQRRAAEERERVS